MDAPKFEKSRLDEAARAGWLYFIAGNTQDEIARKLKVSRPTAQRLVSLALSERLITFRLDHPIVACMELARGLVERFSLMHCDVVPTDPAKPAAIAGVASSAASFLELTLAATTPIIIALGTGRTLRAAVDQIRPMERPNHQLVSLVGNIAPDGSASFFDTLTHLADLHKRGLEGKRLETICVDGGAGLIAASPRHADVLTVTGPTIRNMREALKRTFDANARAEMGGGGGRLRAQRRAVRRLLCGRGRGRGGGAGRSPHPGLPADADGTAQGAAHAAPLTTISRVQEAPLPSTRR
ncbi:MAG: hypothetical protein K8F58_09420 [Bauldia sp.]|nr:hypothetical protein [Bauldia sp.]